MTKVKDSDWFVQLARRESPKQKDTPEPTVTQKSGDQGQVVAYVSSQSETPVRRQDVNKSGSLRFPRS